MKYNDARCSVIRKRCSWRFINMSACISSQGGNTVEVTMRACCGFFAVQLVRSLGVALRSRELCLRPVLC